MFELSHLHELRRHEMERLLPSLPPGARILEFGAGTGEQARFLADHGFDVVAIDLASSNYAAQRVFPVVDYDGRHIPLKDASVDVIFSSNVLEHVENIPEILAEFHRVQRPDGFGLHVLPTPTWRLWTFVSAMLASVGSAIALPGHLLKAPEGSTRSEALKRDLRNSLSGFIPRGHGTSMEGISEFWTFSPVAWRRMFRLHGFDVVEEQSMELFYTGASLLAGSMSLATRRSLSRFLGSATHMYKLKSRPRQRSKTSAPTSA